MKEQAYFIDQIDTVEGWNVDNEIEECNNLPSNLRVSPYPNKFHKHSSLQKKESTKKEKNNLQKKNRQENNGSLKTCIGCKENINYLINTRKNAKMKPQGYKIVVNGKSNKYSEPKRGSSVKLCEVIFDLGKKKVNRQRDKYLEVFGQCNFRKIQRI